MNLFIRARDKLLSNLLLKIKSSGYYAVRSITDDLKVLINKENPVIIDGGAHVGDLTEIFLSQYDQPSIYCFEVNRDCVIELEQRFKDKDNVHIVNKALGNQNGQVQFNISKNSSSSSFLERTELNKKYHGDITAVQKTISANMVKLGDMFKDNGIIDLLKLDVEGYELEVLKGAESILSDIRVIMTEVWFANSYKGAPYFSNIEEYLRANNFMLLNLYNPYTHSDMQLTTADAVFLNKKFFSDNKQLDKYMGTSQKLNKTNKKVAIYPGYSNMLKDQMFDLNSAAAKQLGGLPIFQRYIALRDLLAQKGIELHTFDMYPNIRDIDLWIMLEANPKGYLFLARNLINPKKVIPVILEPSVVSPWEWQYVEYWSRLHPAVLTWSPELVNQDKKFKKFHYLPFTFDASKYSYFVSKDKKNLCLLMQSNKASRVKGELYSLRREIIRYFEKRGDSLLDLYGYGWNSPDTQHLGPSEPFYTPIYKGTAVDKWETFAEYKFVFCIQNAIPAGDFECDAFMAMATGAVPIYLPPPDADKYIPRNTYINYNDFKNLDDLTAYLQSIVGTKVYEEYQKKGWEFINSEKFRPFTVQQFSEDIYRAIQTVVK